MCNFGWEFSFWTIASCLVYSLVWCPLLLKWWQNSSSTNLMKLLKSQFSGWFKDLLHFLSCAISTTLTPLFRCFLSFKQCLLTNLQWSSGTFCQVELWWTNSTFTPIINWCSYSWAPASAFVESFTNYACLKNKPLLIKMIQGPSSWLRKIMLSMKMAEKWWRLKRRHNCSNKIKLPSVRSFLL